MCGHTKCLQVYAATGTYILPRGKNASALGKQPVEAIPVQAERSL